MNVGGAPMRPPRIVDNASFGWEIDVNSNSIGLPWPQQEEQVETTMWPGSAGLNFQGAKTQLGGQPQPYTTILWIETGGAMPGSPSALQPGDRFFFTNALKFLDRLREWYFDPADGGWLYYIPDPGFAAFPNGSTVVVPSQRTVLSVRDSSNVVIAGMQFSDTFMEAAGFFDRSRLPADPAVSVSSSTNISFVQGCRLAGLGGSGIVVANASTGIVVDDAVINGVGQSGVLASSAGSGRALGSVSVTNSSIANTGLVLAASAAVLLDGVQSGTVSGNSITNSTGWGIMVRGPTEAGLPGAVSVSSNRIRASSLASDGTAGIGVLAGAHSGAWSVEIRDNCVFSVSGVATDAKGLAIAPANSAAISVASVATVVGNVLSTAGMAGVLVLPGAGGSTVSNNVVAGVSAPAAMLGVIEAGAALVATSTALGASSTVHSNIVLQLDPHASLVRGQGGQFGRNLFFNPNASIAAEAGRSSAQPLFPTGNWSSWEHGGGAGSVVDEDPLFEDWQAGRFQPQAGSPASKIGFQPLRLAAAGKCGALAG